MRHRRNASSSRTSSTSFRNPNAARVHIDASTRLVDYIEGFLDTGAAALTDVFRSGDTERVYADALVFTLRLPASPEQIAAALEEMVERLITFQVLPGWEPSAGPAETTPAPTSNTGLQEDDPCFSAWAEGYQQGHTAGYRLGVTSACK